MGIGGCSGAGAPEIPPMEASRRSRNERGFERPFGAVGIGEWEMGPDPGWEGMGPSKVEDGRRVNDGGQYSTRG